MKQEVKRRIVAFNLVFWIIFIILTIISLGIKTNLNNSFEKIYKPKVEEKIIFIGDSHIRNGVNDELNKKILNLGVGGESYIFSFEKLKMLDPKIAVIGFWYQNIQRFREDKVFPKIIANNSGYLKYFDYDQKKDINKLLDFETKIYLKINNLFPFIGSKLQPHKFKTDWGKFKDWGSKSEVSTENMKERIDYWFAGYNYKISQFELKYLKKILQYANENNIRVILLSTPVYYKFNNMIPNEVKQKFKKILKN